MSVLLLSDPLIRDASTYNIGQIVRHTYWWPNGEAGIYLPLTSLSYLFNYSVLGNADRAAGYHGVSLFLHAVNVLLLFALTARMVRYRVALTIAAG